MLVIWIHGLTVRSGGRFESMVERVRKEFQRRLPDARVEGCYWGDLGLQSFASLSIPKGGEGQLAIGEPGATGARLDELRAMLLMDWDLELRAIADGERFSPPGGGISVAPPNVEQRNLALQDAREGIGQGLATRLDAAGISVPPATVGRHVGEAISLAYQTDRRLTVGDLVDPMARAITAAIAAETPAGEIRQIDDLESTFDWRFVEDATRAVLAEQLSGSMGLPTTWLKNAALHLATPALARMRPMVVSRMATFIGDCFIYLKDAEPILGILESAIARHSERNDEPLWLVGHSMGGIIAFDYAGRTNRRIDRLVTVGSQVGLFAELNALLNLTRSDGVGPPFAPPASIATWLNVYDRDDMLSFLASPVFGGATDIHLDTGAPFPHSHSEYWDREELYEQICAG